MRRLIFKSLGNKFVIFTILFFITYLLISYIPEFNLGRRLKAILTYCAFFLSIMISVLGIISMLYKRKIEYKKLLV
jgi:magnesium-transporting ATPase (P-type)